MKALSNNSFFWQNAEKTKQLSSLACQGPSCPREMTTIELCLVAFWAAGLQNISSICPHWDFYMEELSRGFNEVIHGGKALRNELSLRKHWIFIGATYRPWEASAQSAPRWEPTVQRARRTRAQPEWNVHSNQRKSWNKVNAHRKDAIWTM